MAARVASLNPDGSVSWQQWPYATLVDNLKRDLQLDATTDIQPGTIVQALNNDSAARSRAAITWHGLPYNATNWTDMGGSFQVGQYGLDALGFVHIRGVCKSVAGYTFTTASTLLVATLPPGFRPGANEMGSSFQFDTANSASYNRLDILTNGQLQVNGGNTVSESVTSGGNNGVAQFFTFIIQPFLQVN